MELIKKEFSLETSINRLNNTMPFYNENGELQDSHQNNWGGYVCDIIIPPITINELNITGSTTLNSDIYYKFIIDDEDEINNNIYLNKTLGHVTKRQLISSIKNKNGIDIVSNSIKYLIGVYELKDSLPLVLHNNNLILRYKTMLMQYYWLLNFIKTCVYYRLCLRGNLKKWVLTTCEFFNSKCDFLMVSELPENNDEYNVGDVICVNSMLPDFIKIFKTIDLAYNYNLFVEDVLNNFNDDYKISIPYINVDINLIEKYDSIGLYTADLPFWEENKKYRLGDIVLFAYGEDIGTAYILKKCDNYELFEVPSTLVDENNEYFIILNSESEIEIRKNEIVEDNTHQYILKTTINGNVIYKYIEPYYKGYYDKVYLKTYFDDLDSNRNIIFNHWEKNIEGVRDLSIEPLFNESGRNVSALTDSSLETLKRSRKAITINGEELPFYIRKKNNIEEDIEILYIIGNCNYNIVGDTVYCDNIESIKFYKDENDKSPIIFNEVNKSPKSSDITSAYTIVEFTYWIGIQLDENGYKKQDTGIKYIEKRKCNLSVLKDCEIDKDVKKDYQYIDIGEVLKLYSDGGNTQMIYTCEQIKLDDFQISHIFKEDDKIGIEDFRKEIDINIDRKSSSAYERHNILGEINSFRDLFNYRNNYFNV